MKYFLAVATVAVSVAALARYHSQSIVGAPTNLKPYYLELLTKGPSWTENSSKAANTLFPRHLEFIRRMNLSHRLLIAGPALSPGITDGVAVWEVSSSRDAQALADQDPEVVAGRLTAKIQSTMLPDLSKVTMNWPIIRSGPR